MILGIGVDLCSIARIEASIDQFGTRFLNRVFTSAEQDRAEKRGARRFDRYAQMFAAKEAAVKALGTGFRQGIGWVDVEVSSNALGKPALMFHRAALTRLEELTPENAKAYSDLALTDESGLAQAMVVLYYASHPMGSA